MALTSEVRVWGDFTNPTYKPPAPPPPNISYHALDMGGDKFSEKQLFLLLVFGS